MLFLLFFSFLCLSSFPFYLLIVDTRKCWQVRHQEWIFRKSYCTWQYSFLLLFAIVLFCHINYRRRGGREKGRKEGKKERGSEEEGKRREKGRRKRRGTIPLKKVMKLSWGISLVWRPVCSINNFFKRAALNNGFFTTTDNSVSLFPFKLQNY